MIRTINNVNEYDIVLFKNNEINKRSRVYRISDNLLVGYNGFDSKTFRIYFETTGKFASPKVFEDIQDAIGYAEWLEETYAEYLPLLTEYPKADIVSLAQWSVKNGKKINEIIQSLPKKITIEAVNEQLREY